MSPRRIRHEDVDFRTDLFSFGVLLYEMVTGMNPFDAGTATASVARTRAIRRRCRRWPVAMDGLEPALGSTALPACAFASAGKTLPNRPWRSSTIRQLYRARWRPVHSPHCRPVPPDRSGPARGSARAWERHQVVASVVYALTVYPAWHAHACGSRSPEHVPSLRCWRPPPGHQRAIACSSRHAVPSELAFQRQRVRFDSIERRCLSSLPLSAAAIGADHSLTRPPAHCLSRHDRVVLIIEPATAGRVRQSDTSLGPGFLISHRLAVTFAWLRA